MTWRIEQGDCLELLKTLPDASVDAVITDPPYSSGGLHLASKRASPNDKYLSAGHWSEKKTYPDYAGDSCDQFTWLTFARMWMAESYRVTKEGGHFYVFCDWRQLAVAITALQSANWQYRGMIVWDKGNTARAPYPGSWRHGAEFLLWGAKGKPWTVTEGKWEKGVAPVHSVLRVNGVQRKEHITEKPVELLETVVRTSAPPEGTVLDPFSGSGSTGVAAIKGGFSFVGFEREQAYVDIARRRLEAASIQPRLDVA